MMIKARHLAATLTAVVLLIAPMPSRLGSHSRVPIAYAQDSGGLRDPQKPSIDFSLRDLDGHVMKLSEYRGHPVVIDFWATWCPPCRHQIPELKKLYSQYHKSKGLVVIGVACDTIQGEGVRSVRPFVKEFEISYPILLAESDVVDSLGVEAIPTTIFLGPDGKIVGRLMGAGAPGELTEGVHTLLAHPAGKSGPEKKTTPADEKKENLYDIDYRN
jgi:thiol-disulfide isomerase/thioredoxin